MEKWKSGSLGVQMDTEKEEIEYRKGRSVRNGEEVSGRGGVWMKNGNENDQSVGEEGTMCVKSRS